jgi:hypothetical protein
MNFSWPLIGLVWRPPGIGRAIRINSFRTPYNRYICGGDKKAKKRVEDYI